MRYRETGEVHKDFHLATDTTVRYLLDRYGEEFVRELFRRTAQRVYRDIHEHLRRGDCGPLLEHWTYFYTREGGRFTVTREAGAVVFHVLECPAARHLRERGVPVGDSSALPTILLNEAWAEGTPFTIETAILRPGEYRQIIRRRAPAA